jgi:diacylglycerol kinase family enzyme
MRCPNTLSYKEHPRMAGTRGPVILIHSPHAGHSAKGDTVADALRRAGVAVAETIPVSALDAQPPRATAWRAAGYAAAVAAGGDGTVGAVASHLAGSDLPLGILPLGTANDVARSFGIPVDLEAACAVVADGVPRVLDMGQALPGATEPGELAALGKAVAAGDRSAAVAQQVALARTGAYFLHTLTLGLNVEFARLATDAARRRRWGPLTYAASALEALTRFRAVPLTVRLDGVAASAYGMWIPPDGDGSARPAALRVEPRDGTRVISGHAIQFAAVVTPVFGGASNLRLPNVGLRDGLLDFLFIEALGPDHLTQLRARLEHWMHHGHEAPTPPEPTTPPDPTEVLALDLPGVWRFQARGATILRPAAMDVTLDGEIRARTPTVVRVAPDALRVLAPTES